MLYCLKKRFQIARKAADTRLRGRPNVIGSGLGIKISEGIRTDEPCLTVFVRRKRSEDKLRNEELIPKEVRRYGLDLPTDVVVLKVPQFEAGINIIDGGTEGGTVGSFGRHAQEFVGVTCEHCIRGPDGNSATPDNITALNLPGAGGPLQLGKSGPAILVPGTGFMPNFGEMDAGLIHLQLAPLVNVLMQKPRRSVFKPPSSTISRKEIEELLLFTPVRGVGARSGPVSARIGGLLLKIGNLLFDFMVETIDGQPITQGGDSGLMWITQPGSAFGLHSRGDGMGPGGRSLRSFGAFAYRIEEAFGLWLVED